MKISSQQNNIVKLATSLHLKKYRDEESLFLVEGFEVISMALQKKWKLHTLFIQDGRKEFEVMYLGFKDKIKWVSREILEKISKKDNPQPVIAIFHKRFESVLPSNFDQEILPALDEIRDPGNLGTIIRTCHALGLERLVLIGNCADPFSPETIRASMGSFAAITLVVVDEKEMVSWCAKHKDTPIIATNVDDAVDYRKVKYSNAVLLMGNERKGVSEGLQALCTQQVHIPMPGGSESLNVAMAATLLLYEGMRSSI